MAESVLEITAKISRVFDVDELDRSYHVWAKDRTFNGATYSPVLSKSSRRQAVAASSRPKQSRNKHLEVKLAIVSKL